MQSRSCYESRVNSKIALVEKTKWIVCENLNGYSVWKESAVFPVLTYAQVTLMPTANYFISS